MKADQLERVQAEISEEIPLKKLYYISHDSLYTPTNIESLTCMLCNGIVNEAIACINCVYIFCKPCIKKHLESSKICPVTGCAAEFEERGAPFKLKEYLSNL